MSASTVSAPARQMASRSLDFIRSGGLPSWSLAILVTLLGWNLSFSPALPGLDFSWMSGLNMAAHDGLDFGSDVIFTYGPLGFLTVPMTWYSGLSALAFVYQGAILFVFVWLLIHSLRARVAAPVACLVAFLVITWLPGIDNAVCIAILWSFLILGSRERDRWMLPLITVGAVFAGAECLMKLSIGPLILAVLLLTLIGVRATWRQLTVFGFIFAGTFLGCWLLTGQAAGDLPEFFRVTWQVVSGYSEAMTGYNNTLALPLIMMIVVLASCFWAWSGDFPDRRSRIAATLIAAGVCLSFYKEGAVRADPSHVAIAYGMFALVWIAVPVRRALLPASLAGLAILAAVAVHQYPPYVGGDVIANVKRAGQGARALIDADRRIEVVGQGRASLQSSYALDPQVLAALDGNSVSVDPFEISAAWAYQLDWSPLPVFQNYSAYTTELDRINADRVGSPDGPERILRSNLSDQSGEFPSGTLDGRFPGWDPPAQAVATVCNFTPMVTSDQWQVLRRTVNRCGPAVPAGRVNARDGETIPVPAARKNEIVYVRIHGLEVQGLEKIISLLYKPGERTATVSDGSVYRLVPGTAADGLLLRSNGVAGQQAGPFAQIPQTSTIQASGGSSDLEFEFFRMKVRPAIRR